jgi:hypothetical protein
MRCGERDMIFFLKPIVKAVESVVVGVRKINLPKLLIEVVNLLPAIVESFTELVKTFDHEPSVDELKQIIDIELDNFIKIADSQFDKIETDMTENIRDEVVGHIAELLRCFLYHRAKVNGYYVENKID